MADFFAFSYISTRSGTKYYLHKTKGRGDKVLYFFSKEERDAIPKPSGYEVVENPKNGHPFLRKKGGGSSGDASLGGGLTE